MTLKEFISTFEEEIVMVDEGTVGLDTILSNLEDWDSMAFISLNAFLDENFEITLSAEQLEKLEKFSDIVHYVEDKLQK